MERYSVYRYNECNENEWNSFVESSDEAWFWHTSYFIKAWPHGENYSFCIKDNIENKIVLVQMLVLGKTDYIAKWHRIPLKKKHELYLMSIGGVACSNQLKIKEISKLRSYYIDYMDSLVETKHISYFNYCVQPTLSKSYWPDICPHINPLIFFGYKNTMSQSYIIDLSLSEDEIFKNYFQTTRNLINRCEKDNEIRIVEANATEKDLDLYYNLHVETYTRTGVPPHPRKYFESIFFDIIPKGYSHILFLYKKDKLVAAHNLLLFKDIAMYWTGASITEKGEGESRLLMHKQILFAKQKGCRFFEVGEAFPNVRTGKLKGLNDFKKSFGGFIQPLFAGEYVINK